MNKFTNNTLEVVNRLISEPVNFISWCVFHECVEVETALFGDWVAGEEAAQTRRVVAVVVVDEVEFGIVVFGTKAERVEGDDVKRGGRIAVRASRGTERCVVVVRPDAVRG